MCDLTCVSWNIMAPVPTPIRYTGQVERMERIPTVFAEQLDNIKFADICVVQESIVNDLHVRLRKGMQRIGFIYETKQLVGSIMRFKIVQGGVVIFSRFPIVRQDTVIFEGLCDKEDCLAAKGAVYAQVKKGNHLFHIFALHLNSWESPKSRAVRRGQMAEVYKFIQRQNIPSDEPVVMMGDFNVDLYSEQRQLKALCDIVKFGMLSRHKDTHAFTSDPMTNQLMGIDDTSAYSSDAFPGGCSEEYIRTLHCVCCPQEWLDHALYSREHSKPDITKSWTRVVPVKAIPFTVNLTFTTKREITDLSDHYPIISYYVFPDAKERPFIDVGEVSDGFISSDEFTQQIHDMDKLPVGLKIVPVVGFILLGIAFLLVLIISCWYLRKWNNEN